ncbi:MAG: glycosyltransferase family 4 protein, partial [Clostridiaceae bacterium]|nr:glycosyltransferase family 4 protein [Clostridiaceae bacterium]
FPLKGRRIIRGEIKHLKYFSFTREVNNTTKYSRRVEDQLKVIIREFEPDIVHIFGTEFPHALSMVKAFDNPERTLVSLQGLCSVIAEHYYAGLPISVLYKCTLRDFLMQNNIVNQRKKFIKRGQFEVATLKGVNYIIGRTEWDKICASRINPKAKYYSVNESLRENFYHDEWTYENCTKYTVFMSQGNYSIKGLHFAIEAMGEVVKKFPQSHLFIAGTNIIKNDNIKDNLKRTYYSKYVENLIKRYDLTNNITFTGHLNEIQMSAQLLNSHVFISTSSIENSPNSLCEAMMLGVPSIASNVGGVSSLMTHQKEGLLYQYDAPYMLAYYVQQLFKDHELAIRLSSNAKQRAAATHDRYKNTKDIFELYNTVFNKSVF